MTTAIDEDDGTASIELALKVSKYFELNRDEAKAISAEVGMAVAQWRSEAAELGLSAKEMTRMASAFEH